MFKRVIFLGILISILLVLMLVKSQTNSSPVSNQNDDSSEYTTVEYKINEIKEDQYYGVSDEGKKIVFSAESIVSGDKIQINDVVICYFEKGNLGKGIIKVEKK